MPCVEDTLLRRNLSGSNLLRSKVPRGKEQPTLELVSQASHKADFFLPLTGEIRLAYVTTPEYGVRSTVFVLKTNKIS